MSAQSSDYMRSDLLLRPGNIISKPENLPYSYKCGKCAVRIVAVVRFLESIIVSIAYVTEGSVLRTPLLHECCSALSHQNFLQNYILEYI